MKQHRLYLVGLAVTLAWFNLAVAAEQPKRPGPPRLPEGVTVVRDIAYVEGGHERQRLDLYLPEKAQEALPVVVWIHGGAWQAGSKDGGGPALPLTAKGYAVASINYRLSQHAVFPAQIEDCKAAIRWLRANAAKYHLDPERIGVWGASAGGHLVALLGTTGDMKDFDVGGNLDQSSRVQAVVDWFGPTDFPTIGQHVNAAVGPVAQLLGGPISENLEKARKASPITYVSKSAAPFLIMHGDGDKTVPLPQSERLAEALKKAGAEVTLEIIKDNGHGGPGFTSPESRKLIEDFFAKHLGKGR
jgi:acetyl esterase/lipase